MQYQCMWAVASAWQVQVLVLEHSGIAFSIFDLHLADSVTTGQDKGGRYQLHQSSPWAPAHAAQVRPGAGMVLQKRLTAMETCNDSCS